MSYGLHEFLDVLTEKKFNFEYYDCSIQSLEDVINKTKTRKKI